MPDNKAEKPEATKDTAKEAAEPQTVAAVKSAPPWPLITIGVLATVVIFAVMIGGWSFIVSHGQAAATQTRTLGRYGATNDPNSSGNRYGGGSGGGQYGRGGFRRGGALGSVAASGVVTAIDGDTITVSGQGKQVTVKKTDSTKIGGDETDVAVNDTVIVYGTTGSDGSVSATRIVVRNAAVSSGSGLNSDSTPGA